jgi:hypothetical protein
MYSDNVAWSSPPCVSKEGHGLGGWWVEVGESSCFCVGAVETNSTGTEEKYLINIRLRLLSISDIIACMITYHTILLKNTRIIILVDSLYDVIACHTLQIGFWTGMQVKKFLRKCTLKASIKKL